VRDIGSEKGFANVVKNPPGRGALSRGGLENATISEWKNVARQAVAPQVRSF
jgi:hypothetical protein